MLAVVGPGSGWLAFRGTIPFSYLDGIGGPPKSIDISLSRQFKLYYTDLYHRWKRRNEVLLLW